MVYPFAAKLGALGPGVRLAFAGNPLLFVLSVIRATTEMGFGCAMRNGRWNPYESVKSLDVFSFNLKLRSFSLKSFGNAFRARFNTEEIFFGGIFTVRLYPSEHRQDH